MLWLILSVLSALFESLKDIASKKGLRNAEPEVAAMAQFIFSFFIVLPLMVLFEKPFFDTTFFVVAIVSGGMLAYAYTLYMKSLKITDVSLAIPFTALTPAFMIVVTPLLIGETVTKSGATGIILIALGAYLINAKNAKKAKKGALEPLRSLLHDRGIMLMLFVAFIWSITATFDRVMLRHASPLFYSAFYYIVVSFFLAVNVLFKYDRKFVMQQLRDNATTFAYMGLFFSLGIITYIYALKATLVAYAIAVRRTNVLFTVLLGALLFKEKNIRERLLGAGLMVAGVAVISMS